jgi:hypothetical protein
MSKGKDLLRNEPASITLSGDAGEAYRAREPKSKPAVLFVLVSNIPSDLI